MSSFYNNEALKMLNLKTTIPTSKTANYGNVKSSINYSYRKAYDLIYGFEDKKTIYDNYEGDEDEF